ncbi:MAG TPA: shikimate dehydrogenase [Pyrinomonadaceae bacterium]|nr:shikimate dehydrogenase [Pyrinomonadaceae bacterium]
MSTAARRICVSICETDVAALTTTIRSAAELGDIVEIRLDCFTEEQLPLAIAELRTQSSIPTILTLRPHADGGRDINGDYRIRFWRQSGFSLPATFVDLEVDIAEQLLAEGDTIVDWSRVICSVHDFHDGINDLNLLYERLARIPARVLKIAVVPDDAVDNASIFRLLSRAKSESRELIAIGMGTAGIATRVLGPSHGSVFTYAAFDPRRPTAPGQPSLTELVDQYRINQINEATQVAGLIGDPVSHSLSPQIHNAAFKAQDLNAVYIPFEVRDCGAFIRRMVHPRTREINLNMWGLSVTSPHKRGVIEHLDSIDPVAFEIGAVNTIIVEHKLLRGYNTDAIGFISALKQRIGHLRGLRCAVIGAGGVAMAAIYTLLAEGASANIFVRDIGRAKAVTEKFGVRASEVENSSFDGYDVVINATGLGTAGDLEGYTPVAAAQLRGARLAYDLVYNPTETRFLREAEQAGCETLGGLSMFVAQAAEQFRLWTGRQAPAGVMHAAAAGALSRQ